jgi:hypothetical protein
MHALHAAALCLLASVVSLSQGTTAGPLTDADRAAILKTLGLKGNPKGQVMNACDELATPQFLPAELGGRAGTATLFAIGGGPKMASCYGDGPDLHLMVRDGAGWREVYAARGRMLIILPTATAGVKDLADGGPGSTFPVWTWNGTKYAATRRSVSDAELEKLDVKFLP